MSVAGSIVSWNQMFSMGVGIFGVCFDAKDGVSNHTYVDVSETCYGYIRRYIYPGDCHVGECDQALGKRCTLLSILVSHVSKYVAPKCAAIKASSLLHT